jgi:hypothetical protein
LSAIAQVAAPGLGEVVTVALPDGSTLWGVVRWVEGKAFGVEFDTGSRDGPVTAIPG